MKVKNRDEIIERYREMLRVAQARHAESHRALMELCDALLEDPKATQRNIDTVANVLRKHQENISRLG